MPYTGFAPDLEPIDAVRFLIGDTTSPFQLTDTEVQFALDSTTNTYLAAAMCARAIGAKYARRVNKKFETISADYGDLKTNYDLLARQLEMQGKREGGLGTPLAGGISKADVESVDALTDRVRPYFRDGQHSNPPAPNE